MEKEWKLSTRQESKEKNDLFFVCSLIEYIARKTKNKKKYIVDAIGKEKITKLYKLADVYHSENIDKVSDEIIEESNIKLGNYELKLNDEKRPTFWELGRIYERLIVMVNDNQEEYINTLFEVMTSWIIEHLDNYNSSLYYENPSYIYECYKEGKIL